MSNKRQLNSHSDLQNSTKRRGNKSNQNDTMSLASRGREKWGRQGSSSSVSFLSRRARLINAVPYSCTTVLCTLR